MATTPRPLRYLSTAIEETFSPISISTSAGLYVCNRVYYEALHIGQKALFVHVPKNMDTTITLGILTDLVGKL